MRRKQRQTAQTDALSLLGRAPEHHLATVDKTGAPVLRVLNGVVFDDWILFHGALSGEKSECMGQPAIVSAYEVIADIPSYFVDPNKACPATTYYRSAQAKGILENVDSVELKAGMLQALMEKLQPEGRHVPLCAEEPLYQKDYRAVRVFGMRGFEVSGKASLGQDKPPASTRNIVLNLWRRGKDADFSAIRQILEASPEARPACFLREIQGRKFTFEVWPTESDVEAHARLVLSEYWRQGCEHSAVARSIRASSAWVGIHDEAGELCAGARALADGDWAATVYDVVVKKDLRGAGLGRWMMEELLEHPRVRHCHRQRLGTWDKADFYRALGFRDAEALLPSFPTQLMAREGLPRSG